MPRFDYVAMDSKGRETEGVLDAASEAEAVALIRSKGYFPTRVAEIGGGGTPRARVATGAKKGGGGGLKTEIRLPRFLGGGVKPKNLMVFTRQLATLVDAGLPLLRGLRILMKQERNVSIS